MAYTLPTPNTIKEIVQSVVDRVKVAMEHVSTILGYPIFSTEDEAALKTSLGKLVKTLYLYAIGLSNEKPEHIRWIIQTIINLVWMKGVVPNDRVQWHFWSFSDPLGLIVRIAETRIKLEEGQYLTATELALLSGTTPGNISHHIRYGNIKAVKNNENDREWLVPPDEARRYIDSVRSSFIYSIQNTYAELEGKSKV